jgi:hypothetical protein
VTADTEKVMDGPRERVLPYATPTTGSIDITVPTSGRALFGVVVRVAGLGITFWGLYTALYVFIHVTFNERMYGQSKASLVVLAVFLLLVGVALLRGEWLVRFAYGPPPRE